MGIVAKFQQAGRQQKWVMPTCFIFSLFFTISALVFCRIRGFSGIEGAYAFSVGADVVSMAVCTALLYSCMQDKDGTNEHTRTFVLLITMNSAVLFSDLCCWLLQGVESLRVLNLIANVINFTNYAALLFHFWRYVATSLDLHGKFMNVANLLMNILYVPMLISCLANLFVPLYFSVDEAGVYHREPLFMFSQTYLAIGLVIVVIGFFISKVSVRERLITASFVIIPVGNQIFTGYQFGLTTSYSAMLVSIVLIFGVLFAEREKTLASTEKELNMATQIQLGMLPARHPPYPERDEFDICASMTPAKEVGGDFYDHFLIDEDHLALVIADVSGKGVPAALFMMSMMILINDRAMSGGTPAEILTTINDRVCENSKSDMFVTVWLGILEISTGKLTCVNAGHEYPALNSDGKFGMFKDKHGFVVGGLEGVKYVDYEIRLSPGDCIFVYTDGVTEATNADNELFGAGRLTDALNEKPDASPDELLEKVRASIDEFVDDAPQFDDLTMLCLKYKGKNEE